MSTEFTVPAVMQEPIRIQRYDKLVFENSAAEAIRKAHCLCLHCGKMKPGASDNCPAAAAYYELCKQYGNAFVMTRCSIWEPKLVEQK